jgi:hypothetical protein
LLKLRFWDASVGGSPTNATSAHYEPTTLLETAMNDLRRIAMQAILAVILGICSAASGNAQPNLIAEIASGIPRGYACPVGNGHTVTVRVRNAGTAAAGRFVVRTEVKLYTGVQYYTFKRHFLVSSLGAGASTTSGVNLGDGVNAAPNSDGRTKPILSIQFFNGVGPNWTSKTRVVSWRVLVDTSMGKTFYGSGSSGEWISYPSNAVVESNEVDNIIAGSQSSCAYPRPEVTKG